jgi:hypothetical protein
MHELVKLVKEMTHEIPFSRPIIGEVVNTFAHFRNDLGEGVHHPLESPPWWRRHLQKLRLMYDCISGIVVHSV